MTTPTLPASRTVQDALAEAIRHHRAGLLAEAERLYREILRVDARNAEALHLLGLVAQQAGFLEAAAGRMRAAIEIEPNEPVYRSNLGNVLQMLGLLEEAVLEYEWSLRLRPNHASTLSNLGTALQSLGRLEEAEASLRRAAEGMPDSAQIQDNLGNTLQALGRLEEAVVCHELALELAPENAPSNAVTHGNLGIALQELGQWTAAMASYERALELAPGNTCVELARAQLQLLCGDFARGLRNYECRKRMHCRRQLPGREWHGEPLTEDGLAGRILLYAEQGLGDTMQFLRYVPLVQAVNGARVVVEVQERLMRLTAELPGEQQVVCAGAPLPEVDWHCSLMSLPLIFHAATPGGQVAATMIPARVPYLSVPEAAAQKVAAMTWPAKSLRVGLVWAGNPSHVKNRFRSIPFPLLEPLLARFDEVDFYSLQLGAADAATAIAEGRIVDLSGATNDMADTAAHVEHFDLVIGVDTAVVHLAGALGKPVWTLLSFSPDWRWELGRQDSAWYPTMRLFRQRSPGGWEDVLEEVATALAERIRKGRG